jgi:hypothetical protein
MSAQDALTIRADHASAVGKRFRPKTGAIRLEFRAIPDGYGLMGLK